MGTRLYPRTENSQILEKLAGVPAGTHEKWRVLKDKETARKDHLNDLWKRGFNQQELRTAYEFMSWDMWHLIHKDEDVEKYDDFITYGWGKIQFPSEYCGEENNPDEIKDLLYLQNADLNGVDIEELEGVYWC